MKAFQRHAPGSMPSVELAPHYVISRLIAGGWQFARGHSARVAFEDAMEAILEAVRQGVTAFDCADIYTGVEELLGAARPRVAQRFGIEAAGRLKFHTKFVPDRDALDIIDRRYVERIIDRSLRRLNVDQLDLVQFHWWDFGIPKYVEAARLLVEQQQAGKVRLIGVTNFDTPRLRELVEAGVPVATHQLQYSLLDQRAATGMTAFCAEHDIHMLCYGTLAGGFIADRFLETPAPPDPPENRSQVKYRLIIEEFGGWGLFQEFLEVASRVAAKHGATVANVAEQYVLAAPQVSAIIVGANRAGHISENRQSFRLVLDDDDRAVLAAARRRSKWQEGEVYDLERVKDGPHAAVMRYDLNREISVG